MRIDEITINIPITIDLDGDKPKVNVAGNDAVDVDKEEEPGEMFINPLQQELELKKAEQGKDSPTIDKMLDDSDQADPEETDQSDNVDNLKTLAGLKQQ